MDRIVEFILGLVVGTAIGTFLGPVLRKLLAVAISDVESRYRKEITETKDLSDRAVALAESRVAETLADHKAYKAEADKLFAANATYIKELEAKVSSLVTTIKMIQPSAPVAVEPAPLPNGGTVIVSTAPGSNPTEI